MSLVNQNFRCSAVTIAAVLVGLSLCGGCLHPLERRLTDYRAAKKRGDYETAAKYLAQDARIWFDKKEGPGHPLRARGGPYKDWDKEFRAVSTRRNVRVKGRSVTYISSEINDFYRLIERVPTDARVTYLLRRGKQDHRYVVCRAFAEKQAPSGPEVRVRGVDSRALSRPA